MNKLNLLSVFCLLSDSKCVPDMYPVPFFIFLFVLHYLLSLAGLDSVTPTEAVAPIHMVRSPPCLYRSAKQIKALSQITFLGTYTIQGQGQTVTVNQPNPLIDVN